MFAGVMVEELHGEAGDVVQEEGAHLVGGRSSGRVSPV
jgi:hypothetical protein